MSDDITPDFIHVPGFGLVTIGDLPAALRLRCYELAGARRPSSRYETRAGWPREQNVAMLEEELANALRRVIAPTPGP